MVPCHDTLYMTDKKQLAEILNILKISRCTDYKDWFKIGAALYNDSPDNFKIWNKWSKKSSKYSATKCKDMWKKFGEKKFNCTMGTVNWMAKTDNKSKYEKVSKKYYKPKEAVSYDDDLFID